MDSQTEEKSKTTDGQSEKSGLSESSAEVASQAADRLREDADSSFGKSNVSAREANRTLTTSENAEPKVKEIVFDNSIYSAVAGSAKTADGADSQNKPPSEEAENDNKDKDSTEDLPEAKETVHNDGSRTRENPDGSTTYTGADGRGWTRRENPDGSLTLKKFGPDREDHHRVDIVERPGGGYHETYTFPHDSSRNYTEEFDGSRTIRRGADGSSSETTYTRDGSREVSSGPNPEHNYVRTSSRASDGSVAERTEYSDSRLNYSRDISPGGSITLTTTGAEQRKLKQPSAREQRRALDELRANDAAARARGGAAGGRYNPRG